VNVIQILVLRYPHCVSHATPESKKLLAAEIPAINPVPGDITLGEGVGLRREPRQQRSRDRVEAILAATSELLEESGYSALTTSAIADRADLTVSSLYQFFTNVDDIVVELVRRWTADFDELVLIEPDKPVNEQLGDVIDRYAEFFRTTPGFRAVYFSGSLRGQARVLDRASNQSLEMQMARQWGEHYPAISQEDLLRIARVCVHIGDALLGLAFRLDPMGDEQTLVEAKRALAAYLESALGR
jgi:AcrR family transcriptional regulator